MQDIEKTCDRVMIIDDGSKVFDGTLTALRDRYGAERKLDVEFMCDTVTEPISGVETVDTDSRHKSFIFGREIHINDVMAELMQKYSIRDINISEADIESVIRKIYSGEGTA